MKILVTGATGFVGSHLCEKLAAEGHEVFALSRSIEKFQKLNLPATLVEGDLKTSGHNGWVSYLPEDLDVVIHTAGVVHAYHIRQFYDVNADATLQLMADLSVRFKKLNFILFSSLAAAGPSTSDRSRLENDLSLPVCEYGQSKFLAEMYLHKYGLSTWKKLVLRPPAILGPRDQGFLDVFKMVKKGHVIYPGRKGKDNTYSFICVHDLTQIIVSYLQNKAEMSLSWEVIYPAYPTPFRNEDFIHKIKEILGVSTIKTYCVPVILIKILARINFLINFFWEKFDWRLTPDKYHEIKQPHWTCDSLKSQEMLHFTYQYDLEKTLKITAEDYQDKL
jgi:nucleoside-diphosphate-sugar epimerase